MAEIEFAKCPRCGSENVQAEGFKYSSSGKIHMLKCRHCNCKFKDEGKLIKRYANDKRYHYLRHRNRCGKELPRGTGHRTTSKIYCDECWAKMLY